MVNIIGPFGAGVNPATTRPEPAVSGSGTDTWFKPCVDGDETTGTRITSDWLNKVIAQLRRAIRGMGVADVELDDDMLLKAIQNAEAEIVSLGDGVEIYAGLNEAGEHQIRALAEGAGVTITVDEETGDAVIALNAVETNAIENIGDGTGSIYKTFAGGFEQLRTLRAGDGIGITTTGDVVEIESTATTPSSGDVIIRQRNVVALTQSVNTTYNSPTTSWTGTYSPKGASNTMDIKAHLQIGVDSSGAIFWLEWRVTGGVWATLQTKTIASLGDGGVNYYPDLLLCGEIAIPASPSTPDDIEVRVRHRAVLGSTNYIMATSRVEVVEYQEVV